MPVARSAMGRHSLPMVQCEGIWLPYWIRLDPGPIHCNANEKPKQVSLAGEFLWPPLTDSAASFHFTYSGIALYVQRAAS
jgi:hypothetical protein